MFKNLDNALEQIDCGDYNNAMSSICEAKDRIKMAKEDMYQKKAYLLTEFGLDGTTCKKVHAWLDSITLK